MKRTELERHLGKNVVITLFDGRNIDGVLHKTTESQFKDSPNLYLKKNCYFVTNKSNLVFKCSHVTKLKEM